MCERDSTYSSLLLIDLFCFHFCMQYNLNQRKILLVEKVELKCLNFP
ncbi:hypothetical protein TSMEX_006397 [Taenia solium]|eukprot:TsM_000226600 transcript=TsM_000226600 gene=TsM_000226600